MQPLTKRCAVLSEDIEAAINRLHLEKTQAEIAALEAELSVSEVWNNPEYAQTLTKKLAHAKAAVEPWLILRTQVADIGELMAMDDGSLRDEFSAQVAALEEQFEALRTQLLFNGPYDDRSAIIRLSAGAGGTDAQDWAEMLERMYLRWAERAGFETKLLERSAGEEAGIKSAVILVDGPFACGRLRAEHGVHRLVRLSPFNSDNLRQTSFALVEILPQIDTPHEVVIDEKDLKIDVYRAGGHGGQSVNTTDSAVRVTHIPTGIVVAIQNERSQLQNKETAMKVLRGKLAQLQLEQHAQSVSELQAGESASWGSQIRNYVLHPYTLVKDTRTKYEIKDAQRVLDGDIDGFSRAYLESLQGESA